MHYRSDTVIQPQAVHFAADLIVPNNRILSVLLYRAVLDPHAADKATSFEQIFTSHGWEGTWRNSIFDYHHYHSNAHEVLGVAQGQVEVHLGGESGKIFKLIAGDMVVLPAGTGHKCVTASKDLLVVGAYPAGQEAYDICKTIDECPGAEKRIAQVALPKSDPFYGPHGPLMFSWVNASANAAA